MRGIIAAAIAVLSLPASAGEPAAIVEDASDGSPVEIFSYLEEGRVLNLSSSDAVVIGYLESCIQERITGGVVTIGRTRSTVRGGERTEKVLRCGAAPAELSKKSAERGAVLVMRGKKRPPSPTLVIRSTTPVIAPTDPAQTARLSRLDRSEPNKNLRLRKGVADLAELGVTLAPGGIYKISSGSSSLTFQVESAAKSGGPVLSRLLAY